MEPESSLRRIALRLETSVFGGPEMAPEGLPDASRAYGRTHEAVTYLPSLLREPPQAHPHHQRPGEAKPGDKTLDTGAEDLPQSGGVLAISDGFGGGAVRGVAHEQTLPGHART